jgi:hypothetical protein
MAKKRASGALRLHTFRKLATVKKPICSVRFYPPTIVIIGCVVNRPTKFPLPKINFPNFFCYKHLRKRNALQATFLIFWWSCRVSRVLARAVSPVQPPSGNVSR